MIIPTLLFIAFSFLPISDLIPALNSAGGLDVVAALAIVLAVPKVLSGVAALRSTDSILLLCLWITITLSQPMQGWFGGAIPAFLAFSVPALSYYLLVVALDDMKSFGRVAAVIVITALAICSLALSEYYSSTEASAVGAESSASGEHLNEKFVLTQTMGEDDAGEPILLRRIRGSGVLEDPNGLAQFLLVVAPFLLLAWQPGRPIRNLFVVLLPAAVMGHTLYLTHSRGALVGIAGMAATYLYRRLGLRGLAVGAVVVMILFVGGFGGGRSLSSDDDSAQGRIVAWSEGLQMLKQSPLFGVGFRSFIDHHALTAHNSFVLCFAELGLVGYFFWLGLIVHGLFTLRAVSSGRDSTAAKWADVLTLSFAAYLATAFFLSRTYVAIPYIVLALITALRYMQSPPQVIRSSRSWMTITAAGVIVSPICIYVLVRLTQITDRTGS